MAAIYKEATFPIHYREAETRQIMEALYRLRSIAVTGLAGMGKSNLVRFVVSHPQVRARYLRERAGDFAFLHLDCAGLARWEETDLLGEIASQLRGEGLAGAPPTSPPAGARHSLKQQILGIAPDLNLVLFLDYFDQALTALGPSFFNYLFHLRNSRPRANLCYVLATRRPLGPLHELQELLDDDCVVGPLSQRDGRESLQRDEERLGYTFNAAQRDALIACTGGHAGSLKNAAELLCSGQVDLEQPGEEVARQLLHSDRVRRLCQELWDDLRPAEQGVLLRTALDLPPAAPAGNAEVALLERYGLLVRQGGRPGTAAIFCPLFAEFTRGRSAAAQTVRISAVFPNQARIEAPSGEVRITLTPRLFALLLTLAEARGHFLSADEVVAQVYGQEAEGVSAAALSQLVKRLRRELDPPVRRLTGNPAFSCVETVRSVGFRFNG